MRQSGFERHIGKRSVAIIFEKMIDRFLSRGKPFQSRAVHQENIQPAIVVVVIECDAAASRFQQIFVLVLAAKDRFCV